MGEHGLARFVGLIAGQELGSKKEHLALAPPSAGTTADKILMIGDAPGDLKAARGQRRPLLPDRPRPRGRVVAAVLRGGPAPILRRHLRRRLHGRADRRVRGPPARDPALDPILIAPRSVQSLLT